MKSRLHAKHRRSFRLSFIILDQEKNTATTEKLRFKTVPHPGTDAPECTDLFMKGYDTLTAITEHVSCPNRPKEERGKND